LRSRARGVPPTFAAAQRRIFVWASGERDLFGSPLAGRGAARPQTGLDGRELAVLRALQALRRPDLERRGDRLVDRVPHVLVFDRIAAFACRIRLQEAFRSPTPRPSRVASAGTFRSSPGWTRTNNPPVNSQPDRGRLGSTARFHTVSGALKCAQISTGSTKSGTNFSACGGRARFEEDTSCGSGPRQDSLFPTSLMISTGSTLGRPRPRVVGRNPD
jgi:hypothetical protein